MSMRNLFGGSFRARAATHDRRYGRHGVELGKLAHRFRADERGNFIIMGALLLPIVVGAVGTAVSFSNGNATRTSMQSALDAAVLAGLSESNSADPVATANNVFKANINNFAKSVAANVNASFNLDGLVLTGNAVGTAVNPFGGLIGSDTYPVTAKSAAIKDSMPICVLGLDSSVPGAFQIDGNPKFKADCAVQVNSSNSAGILQNGKAPVIAKNSASKAVTRPATSNRRRRRGLRWCPTPTRRSRFRSTIPATARVMAG